MNLGKNRYLIIIIFTLLFIFMGMCIGYMAEQTSGTLKESVRDELRGSAAIIASEMDGDILAELLPGDEGTPSFQETRDHLNRMRSAYPALSSIYTMRKGAKGVEFIVDADYGITPDAAVIGQVYPEANDQLLTGFLVPSADREYTTDTWGIVLSGYAPVRNRNGTTVAIVGVDMTQNLITARQDILRTQFIFITILALIFAACGVIAAEAIRARSIRELAGQKEYLDTLLNAVPVGILVIDAVSKNIVDLNDQAAMLIGLPKDEIIGRLCHQFICSSEVGKCPITDLGQTVDNAERELLVNIGPKIMVIKTVRQVTIMGKNYLVESFQQLPDR
jgi:sensor histidine kinase regulating citrate/malate metabolism